MRAYLSALALVAGVGSLSAAPASAQSLTVDNLYDRVQEHFADHDGVKAFNQ